MLKRLKKTLAVLICFALCFSLLPCFVFAEETAYGVWVNGTEFTSLNAETGIKCGTGTAVFDPENGVITLENATVTACRDETAGAYVYRAAVVSEKDVTVKLIGNNVVSADIASDRNMISAGIYCAGKLTVTGVGYLSVSGSLSGFRSAGITAADVLITGGAAVSAAGGRFISSVNTFGYGIALTGKGSLEIKGGASVTAVSYKENTLDLPAVSRAVYSQGSVTVSGGASLEARALPAADNGGTAIYSTGNVYFGACDVTAVADGENGTGIELRGLSGNYISFGGGNVYSTGCAGAVVTAYGDITAAETAVISCSASAFAGKNTLKEASVTEDAGRNTVLTADGTAAQTVFVTIPYGEYPLWVSGVKVTTENYEDVFADGTVSFDPRAAVLTLDGAVLTGEHSGSAIYSTSALEIVLNGNNTVAPAHSPSAESSYGITCSGGLSITGMGSLTVDPGDAYRYSYGIFSSGSLLIKNADITVRSGAGLSDSMAVYASGAAVFSGSCVLDAESSDSRTVAAVCADGGITVCDNARIKAVTGNSTGDNNYAVKCGGTMSVKDFASLELSSGGAGLNSIALYVTDGGDGFSMTGGSITAVSSGDAVNSEAVYINSSAFISGGSISARSGSVAGENGGLSYALTVKEVLALNGGALELTSADAVKGSCALYTARLLCGGKTVLTAQCGSSAKSHVLSIAPEYVSYIPTVFVGDAAPGNEKDSPLERDYVNNKYVHIERKFKSDADWYALTLYDSSYTFKSYWLGFETGTVNSASSFCRQYGSTVAADYYNGYVYGFEDTLPYKMWRSSFDGEKFLSFEYVGSGTNYVFNDVSFDYSSDTMYAIGTFNMTRALFTVDLSKGTAEKKANITGAEGTPLTLAINNAGEAYTVNENGTLYKIGLSDGKAEKVGETGIKADHIQSMAFDRETGELFWSQYCSADGKSGFYCVDTVTGKARKVDTIAGRLTETAALFMIPDDFGVYVAGSPVNTANYKDVFGNGMISFDPEASLLTVNGAAFSSYTKTADNKAYGIYSELDGLKISFTGENTIVTDAADADLAAAVYAEHGAVEISGGKLTAAVSCEGEAYAVYAPGGFTLDNTSLIAASSGSGICAENDSADINIKGCEIAVTAAKKGLFAGGGISVAGSTAVISADTADGEYTASVYSGNDIVLENSVLTVTSAVHSGIYAPRKLKMTDSRLNAVCTNGSAVNTKLDISDYPDATICVNSVPAAEHRFHWNNAGSVSFFPYLCVFPAYSLPGDADNDGFISSADARLALRISVGLEKAVPGEKEYLVCDVDGNLIVESADARIILRRAVGLEDAGGEEYYE